MKDKCIETSVSFENHPFDCFLPFVTFLTASMKSSLSLIGSIMYLDFVRSQEHLKFLTLADKSGSRLLSPWKTKLLPFFGHFYIFDSFFEVLIVPDRFHRVP